MTVDGVSLRNLGWPRLHNVSVHWTERTYNMYLIFAIYVAGRQWGMYAADVDKHSQYDLYMQFRLCGVTT